EFVEVGSARFRSSGKEAEADIRCWCRLIAHSLNYLGAGFGASGRGGPPPRRSNPAQRRAMARLAEVLQWFLAEDDADPPALSDVFREARQKKFNYGGEAVTHRRELYADLVFPTWPASHEVGVLDLTDLLVGDLKATVQDPSKCLRPRGEWPDKPHVSRVHASQHEWDKLAGEGLRRGIFQEIEGNRVFKAKDGSRLLNGAMGVNKFKEVQGKAMHHLRAITIMTPLNQHLREITGEVDYLPCIAHAILIILGADEEAVVDSEDFVSCFNLVRMPRSWTGFLAYEKPVSGSVLGRPDGCDFLIGITTVPMGWSGAVAVIQAAVRRLVFGDAEVDVQTRIARCKPFPRGPDYSLVYLDPFDFIRKRCRQALGELGGSESKEHARFLDACRLMGLPLLNAGKTLVGSYRAALQGGEFDGRPGSLARSQKRGRHLIRLTSGMAAQGFWPEVVLRHWAELACYARSYRRPLFSLMAEVFTTMDNCHGGDVFHEAALDEIILFAALAPLAATNLRAPLAPRISCTDASPDGGGAGLAASFSKVLGASCAAQGPRRSCQGVPFGSAPRCLHVGLEGLYEQMGAPIAEKGIEVKMEVIIQNGVVKNDVEAPEAWAHFQPEGRTVARSGDGIALRSWRARKGLPRLPAALSREVRKENLQHALCARALQAEGKREGATVAQVDSGSWWLEWPRLKHLRHMGEVFYTSVGPHVLAHTSPELHQKFLGRWSANERAETALDWVSEYAEEVHNYIARARTALLPSDPGERQPWLRRQLAGATNRLADGAVNEVVAQELMRWISGMLPGLEAEHVCHLIRYVDHRGSDVQLWAGELLRQSRQAAPCPAFRWAWKAVASYPWSETGHINVLEVLAFLYFVRQSTGSGVLQSTQFVHVVDGMVASAVIATGRSSSKLLNFRLRQLAGLLLAADAYPYVVWAISSWNFADRASRWWPALPHSLEELDARASEFVDHLWGEGEPESWATDIASGLKRLVPRARKALTVTGFFLNNWRRTVSRCRALPFTPLIVKGLAGMAFAEDLWNFGTALLVGFVGLLRTDEILGLRSRRVMFYESHQKAIIILPETKTGSREARVEKAMVNDTVVVRALAKVCQQLNGDELLLPMRPHVFNEELRRLAEPPASSHGACLDVACAGAAPRGISSLVAAWGARWCTAGGPMRKQRGSISTGLWPSKPIGHSASRLARS
ncbi:unnamed protein product, partial [Prorocentrum cordatum]